MCNTTCNNHSYVDTIPENAQIYYVLDGENECNCCNCKKSTCEEPKKVSCRSLACQQLNDECSCECKKPRKTTMVNVLENNVIRLEDKMNEGCADMHESIEEIVDNVNEVYNALKDEEARAKQQEAFLHYGLDDAVTRAWYNPEDRKIHFYHKNPSNCLNTDVHEGCDCDCCNACGCECNCNNDECKSDIPYTMDENCNIVPMSRDEEELPFTIDCTDFLRDIFVSNAYLEEGLVDPEGDVTHQFLIIEFTRWLEPDIERDDDQSVTPQSIRIDLTELWKLDNYYDKWKIDEIVAEIYRKIQQEVNTLNQKIDNTKNELNQTINNTKNELNQTINNTKNEINQTVNDLQQVINNLNTDVPVENLDVVVPLGSDTPTAFATVKGQEIKIRIAAPEDTGGVEVINRNVMLTPNTNPEVAVVGGTSITVQVPNYEAGSDVTIQNATLDWGTAVKYGTMNGTDVYLTLPQRPEPGTGADGNDYVVSGVVQNNKLILTRKDGGTVPPIDLPEQPRHITNITQEGDTVTFTWSDGTPTTINVGGGGSSLWEVIDNDTKIIPINRSLQVHGAGFYDTTVS